MCLCPIVLGELRSGFLKGDAAIHDYLRRQGTPVSPHDLWIAASAAQHGLTIATLDGDFDRIPQVMVRRLAPSP